MKDKPCLTCKDRKIACDRTSPICQNCIRSRRPCRSFHIRLSWPRANDERRATVLRHPRSIVRSTGIFPHNKFINTFSKDIEIHGYLLDPVALNMKLGHYLGTFGLTPPLSLSNHSDFASGEAELVPYFFSVVLSSLPAFGIDLENLRGVITRLAILDDSASSKAVLNSLLALATIYRNENRKQATRYIATALSSLRISVQKGIESQQGLQHILAGILICSFEIHLFSQSSSIWLLYLFGSKVIINQVYQHVSSEDEDQSLLFQWVFYFDTIARLGIRHWHGHESIQLQLMKEVGTGSTGYTDTKMTIFKGLPHKALELLFAFSAGLISPDDPNYHSVEYITWLHQIEKQLSAIRRELKQHASKYEFDNQSESNAVKELFVLAALLYFKRKSSQLVGQSCQTDAWVEDAFMVLSKIDYCNKPFPLFILAFEARTDDKRLLILDVLDRTIRRISAGSLVSLRELLLKLWIQDDLNAEGNMDSTRNWCFLLSICKFMPCLL